MQNKYKTAINSIPIKCQISNLKYQTSNNRHQTPKKNTKQNDNKQHKGLKTINTVQQTRPSYYKQQMGINAQHTTEEE